MPDTHEAPIHELLSKNLAIDPVMLDRVLTPYKPSCRYLKTAMVGREAARRQTDGGSVLASLFGRFVLPESCYITATGHFNSVEFNICYNQLAYGLIAACVADKLLPVFSDWTLDDFYRKQLP